MGGCGIPPERKYPRPPGFVGCRRYPTESVGDKVSGRNKEASLQRS